MGLSLKDAAEMCQGLEAWNNVLICGELKESEYNGNKEFSVYADIVLTPNAQIAAMTALNEVRSIRKGVPSSDETRSSLPDAAEFDLDQSDIDDIFPGL